jgi:nicotinate-nucleotide pyrophosphorylase (carboxylating)
MDLSHLFPPSTLKTKVREWLDEDIPSFDYAGAVVGDKQEVV